MHHKEKKRSATWLKDLRQKQYIEWIYDKDDFINKILPSQTNTRITKTAAMSLEDIFIELTGGLK